MTTPLTGTVTLAALRAHFDESTADLRDQAKEGRKDSEVRLYVASLATAALLRDRSVAWVQQDDAELRIISAHGIAASAGRTLSVALEVENGDGLFLVDHEVAVSVSASGAGTFYTRNVDGDFRTTTGPRIRLQRGVRYRLSVFATGGAWTEVEAYAQIRSVRRRA
jgi:hypothetical protein